MAQKTSERAMRSTAYSNGKEQKDQESYKTYKKGKLKQFHAYVRSPSGDL